MHARRSIPARRAVPGLGRRPRRVHQRQRRLAPVGRDPPVFNVLCTSFRDSRSPPPSAARRGGARERPSLRAPKNGRSTAVCRTRRARSKPRSTRTSSGRITSMAKVCGPSLATGRLRRIHGRGIAAALSRPAWRGAGTAFAPGTEIRSLHGGMSIPASAVETGQHVNELRPHS